MGSCQADVFLLVSIPRVQEAGGVGRGDGDGDVVLASGRGLDNTWTD